MNRQLLIAFAYILSACQTGLIPLTKRPLQEFRDEPRQYLRKTRNIESLEDRQNPEVFVKESKVVITPKEKVEDSGSLFQIENSQNYLFHDKPRGDLGDLLTVYVRSSNSQADPENPPNPISDQNAELAADVLEKDLLESLPDLTPGTEKPRLQTKISFKVMRRLSNGDVIVESFRHSRNNIDSNLIKIQARVPAEKLHSNLPILTTDLKDVLYYQNKNQETVERQSTSWENEYTLRLSGFEEARSKEALVLEAKRKDLMKLRDQLKQRIINVSNERQLVAKERSKIETIKSEYNKKIEEIQASHAEKEAMIEEQKQIIKKQEEMLKAQEREQSANVEP